MKENIVYMLKCTNQSIYTGWTNDFIKRMKAHQNGTAAHYTHAFPPKEVLFIEVFETKNEAMRKEAQIKQLNRTKKLKLIEQNASFTKQFLDEHPFTFTSGDK